MSTKIGGPADVSDGDPLQCSTACPHLDMRRQQWRGGTGVVSIAAGVARCTLQEAVHEVRVETEPATRVRRSGAGRKKLVGEEWALLLNLDIVDLEARGDLMCPRRWTPKSTWYLAAPLVAMDDQASADTVGRLLEAMSFSLQATACCSADSLRMPVLPTEMDDG